MAAKAYRLPGSGVERWATGRDQYRAYPAPQWQAQAQGATESVQRLPVQAQAPAANPADALTLPFALHDKAHDRGRRSIQAAARGKTPLKRSALKGFRNYVIPGRA